MSNLAAMPPETAVVLAEHRTHSLSVDGRCPRCGVGEWDSDHRPLTERVTGYAANATCPKARVE